MFPPRTIVGRVEAVARHAPDRVAVRDDTAELTFAELIRRSRSLAAALTADGVRAGQRVGVIASRDRRTLVAVLAVMTCGAAWVPLEPTLPSARVQSIADEAGLRHYLRPDPAEDVLLAGVDVHSVDDYSADDCPLDEHPADGSSLAYVIFTSGSTGRPKGVGITHDNVLNLLDHMAGQPGLQAGEVMLGVTTPAFDLAVPDLFLPLVVGATLVLAPRAACVDGAVLHTLLQSARPDLMQATPSTWRLLLAAGWAGAAGLRIVCGGEAYEAALARELAARVDAVWNFYGPTETTVWSVAQTLGSDALDPIPMGFAVRGTRCHVVRPDGSVADPGETGELLISGAGVSVGYLNRPDLDSSFVTDPDGERAFATGDFVRRDTDGRLTFVERRDAQVKLRGYRVELGDVETALRSAPGVAQAAAVVLGDPATQIAAFVIAAAATPPDERTILDALGRSLPPYMVPSRVHVVTELALTPNGKVDRRALTARAAELDRPRVDGAAPTDADMNADADTDAAGSLIEQMMAQVWSDVLGVPVLGMDDDFFALGGDSLAATRIAARVGESFGVRIGVVDVFQAPTVADLALIVMAGMLADGEFAGVPDEGDQP